MCRIRVVENVVRVGDTLALDVMSGSAAKAVRCVLTAHRMDAKEEVALGTVAFDPSSKPVVKRFEARLPKQGVWRIRVDGVEDSSAGTVVSVDVKPTAPGTDLVKTLVADIDCVATSPYREVDGTTRIVDAPFGRYRESSGNASNRDWALDGFSYSVDIPDIRHTYLLEVAYPDDTFRSIGFWTNDRGRLDTPVAPKNEGVTLTGGVETGGFYPISNAMDTHEAFFYPTGTNLLIAIINLNAGSRAAASRIRVWRIDGPLPAAAEGIVKGGKAKAALERAWDAAIAGRWWRTRMELASAPVMADFAEAGRMPRLLDRSPFPNRMDAGVRHGHWTLCTPLLSLASLAERTLPSESVNVQWKGDRVIWGENGAVTLRFSLKAAGRCDLHIGHVAAKSGYATVEVNGKRVDRVLTFVEARMPGTDILRGVEMPAGEVAVRIVGTSPLGVYAVRCLPSLKPIPGRKWELSGSIDSPCRQGKFTPKSISESFANLYRTYAEKRDSLKWHSQVKGLEDGLSDRGLYVPLRSPGMRAKDSWIARTEIRSDSAKRVILVCAIDWWCKVLVNGKEVETDCKDASGANFNTHFPYYTGIVDLREGVNEVVVLGQSGSFGAAFAMWISDDNALKY